MTSGIYDISWTTWRMSHGNAGNRSQRIIYWLYYRAVRTCLLWMCFCCDWISFVKKVPSGLWYCLASPTADVDLAFLLVSEFLVFMFFVNTCFHYTFEQAKSTAGGTLSERERQTEINRDRDRQRDREIQRERHRHTDRKWQIGRDR